MASAPSASSSKHWTRTRIEKKERLKTAPFYFVVFIFQVTQLDLKNVGKLVTQGGYFISVQVIGDSRKLFTFQVPLMQKKYLINFTENC